MDKDPFFCLQPFYKVYPGNETDRNACQWRNVFIETGTGSFSIEITLQSVSFHFLECEINIKMVYRYSHLVWFTENGSKRENIQ